ncbi:hypothetical protein ASD04_07100 [Devosia sp. Root436]|uniref:metallophosphoesterase n=1 Tax=Devosia sp. Root436 TaxID=1736537 RepID=UPI0006F8BA8F|nr:metallophosphoesterase [Devosia sp. Root436]KQX40390.1 hypothetical protein ASD04_07100 [Devosia sp. Root436]
MTKIWLLSDIHQEFTREPEAAANPATRFSLADHVPSDVDVVVIAGDLDVSLENSLSRISQELPGLPVVYVPGNHDFYTCEGDGFTLQEMKARGSDFAQRLGIHLLQDDSIEIAGTRFIGSTLWTDFDSVGTGFLRSKTAEAEGRHGMNDYRRIKRASTATSGKRKRIRAQDTVAEHRKSRAYIERELQTPFAGPTVVVTHHAPHPKSLDPRHGSLNFCYASNLQGLLEEPWAPDMWLHGHIHAPTDYTVGRTRIVSNPRGYAFDPQDAHNGFQPDLILEVGEPKPKLGW